VSNTPRDDAVQLQAKSVSYHLRSPVLLHTALKPSYASAALPGLAPHKLVVVGDRIFTDIVLAHHLSHPRTLAARIASHLGLAPAQDSALDYASEGSGGNPPRASLAVWTTGVWERESVGMRWAEGRLVEWHVEGMRERRGRRMVC